MICQIQELKTLTELQRESSTNQTTKPHAEPDPKKNLQPQTNEAEYLPQKTNQQKLNLNNNKPQAFMLSLSNPTSPHQKSE